MTMIRRRATTKRKTLKTRSKGGNRLSCLSSATETSLRRPLPSHSSVAPIRAPISSRSEPQLPVEALPQVQTAALVPLVFSESCRSFRVIIATAWVRARVTDDNAPFVILVPV